MADDSTVMVARAPMAPMNTNSLTMWANVTLLSQQAVHVLRGGVWATHAFVTCHTALQGWQR